MVMAGTIRFLLWLAVLLLVFLMTAVKMPRLVRQLASIYPTSNSCEKLYLELSSSYRCCIREWLP